MEKYCRLSTPHTHSRLMELHLDVNNEHDDDDVPLDMGDEGVATQNRIFLL